MDPILESLLRRVDETARNHMDAMKKDVTIEVLKGMEALWSRHGHVAGGIVNHCIANKLSRGSGFRFGDSTEAAFLVTATNMPFPEFTQWMNAESSSGLRAGLGYFASLEDLLRVPDVFQSPFKEFHHWVFSSGKHGCWVTFALGSRAAGRTEFELAYPPVAILNNYEKSLFVWLDSTPKGGKRGFPKCGFQEGFLASSWSCKGCEAINLKAHGLVSQKCQKCGWNPDGWELSAGLHDAYSILMEKNQRAHLLYRYLAPPAWYYIRTITNRDCDRLRDKFFQTASSKNNRLLEAFSENVERINALATYTMGGSEVGPVDSVIYGAAFLRLAQTHAFVNEISLDEAQSAVFPAIGGVTAHVERKVARYVERMERKLQ